MIAQRSVDKLVLPQILGVAALCLVPTPWIAFPAAALLALWFPGRLLIKSLGWDRGCAGQAGLAVAASVVLIPLPLSWLWSCSNNRWRVLAALLAVNLLLLVAARYRKSPGEQQPSPMFSTARLRWAFAALILFVGGCVFGTIYLPQADDRMIVQPMGDYVKHHAVLLSLERHTLPLHNIFYSAEKDTPYYYYQYHHHVAAALRKLTADAVSIPLAFAFTSAITAMVFVAMTFLLAREFFGEGGERGAWLAALCVSLIGGWDIIPTVIRMAAGAGSVIILDSWSSCPWRIHNLMTQFMWCPQHVAATLAIILAARWLRRAPASAGWIWMGPVLGASIFGSSVHLAMTVFAAAAIYVLLRLWSARHEQPARGRLLLGVIIMALLGIALMGWQAWGYNQMAHRIPGGMTAQWPRFEYAFIGRLAPPGPLANVLDAPWMLLIDFGLPLVACLLVTGTFWRSIWRDEGLRLLMLIGSLGVLLVLVVRSNHSPFDYSFRIAVMPAQVMAAICAGALRRSECVRPRIAHHVRLVVVAGGLLGLPVGLYEAPMMAVRTLLRPPFDQRADQGAIRFLRDQTPLDAVIQGEPVRREGLSQLTNRQIGVTDYENSHVRVFYPEDMVAMQRAQTGVQEAFETGLAACAFERLHHAGVNYVLAGTVEQQLYGPLRQFDNEAWFECVYRDNQARVYRLRGKPDGPPATTLNPCETSD
jgi:hypothetical protein